MSEDLQMKQDYDEETRKEVAMLSSEIEDLMAQADQLLLDVVQRRKKCPELIAQMLTLEKQEKFARLLEAPLAQNSLKEPINVTQMKEDIMKKMNDIQELELRKKDMEEQISKLRVESAKTHEYWEYLCDKLMSIYVCSD